MTTLTEELERYKYEGDTETFILPVGTEAPPWKEEFSKYVKIAWEFTEATTELTDEIVATYPNRAQFIQAYDVLKFFVFESLSPEIQQVIVQGDSLLGKRELSGSEEYIQKIKVLIGRLEVELYGKRPKDKGNQDAKPDSAKNKDIKLREVFSVKSKVAIVANRKLYEQLESAGFKKVEHYDTKALFEATRGKYDTVIFSPSMTNTFIGDSPDEDEGHMS
jgi:hypothetical protein